MELTASTHRVVLLAVALAVGACGIGLQPGTDRGGGAGAGGRGGLSGEGGTGGDGRAGAGGGGAGGAVVVEARRWAEWPMPNQPGRGLPHEQRYTVMTVTGDEVVRDEVTGLMWQRDVSPGMFTWQAAVDHCAALTFAGWNDWRLPSRVELVSLLDLSRTNPSINLSAFPTTPGEWFWTASRRSDDSTKAWYVYFYFGYPDAADDQNTSLARCVR